MSRSLTRRLSFLPVTVISFLFLPGVIIHELSHYLLAAILFVPVSDIEFMPQSEEGELKLGSVSIGATDPVRRFFIGVAPIIGGLGIVFGIFQFVGMDTTSFIFKIILFYVLFTIGNTMFSSKKDIEGATTLLIVVLVVTIAAFVMGIRPQAAWFESNFFISLVNSAKQIDLYLGVLIGFDVLAYLLVRRLRG